MAETCIASFQQCLHKAASVHPRELSLVEDQLARFSVWTGNIRVFGSSRQSLDHRLRESPEVRDTFVALLEAIEYRVETCKCTLQTLADGTLTAVDEVFQHAVHGIADQISLLHRLSNTIRRASKESQNLEAARAFRICDDDGNDTEDFLRLIFANYIRDRFPTTSEAIQQRLAGTMTLRRRRILYRRSRYGSTPIKVLDVPSQPNVEMPRAQPSARPQKPVARQETGDLQSQSGIKSSAQSATTLAADNFHKASAPSVVSVSKTVALSSHEELAFPPAPTGCIKTKQRQLVQQRKDPLKQRLGGQDRIANAEDRTPAQDWEDAVIAIGEVTCPFCFYALPTCDVVDETKWKRHVISDLDAYVCLFNECERPEELYSHSSQWLEHMRQHALQWRCTSRSHGEFLSNSRGEYIEHMKTAHQSRLTDAQLRLLADKSARTIRQIFKSCPLCGIEETRDTMEEHVVGHLRLLALKSLPTYEDGEPGDPDSASEEGSAPWSRSTVRDFVGTHTEDPGWLVGLDTGPAASSTSSGSGSGIRTTGPDYFYETQTQPTAFPRVKDLSGLRHQSSDTDISHMDPACAICRLPAEAACSCEPEALDLSVRQVETTMMQPIRENLKMWVRSHAEAETKKIFTDVTASATAALHDSKVRKEVNEVIGDASEPTAATLKAKINELWCETVETYPEALEYFYSLPALNLPSDDDPAVRDPPL
ncbi:hypothetical protein CONLIGDRAFT_593596, partial [Coniochaeta ligniaria NRRL 30616]